MILDLAVLQENTALEADTIADDHIRSDNDVRANATVLSDLCRRVHHNVATINIRLGVGSEQLGAPLRERCEIEAGAAKKVLRLADIHPETLQVEGVEFAVLANGGEGLLLDRGRAQLNAIQDAGAQDVDTGIDPISNELDGFLDEAVDARGVVRLVDDDTVLGGLIHLGDNNGSLVPMILMELRQFFERKVANNIGVQDEKGRVILAQDLLCQFQGAGGSERFGLDGKLDSDVVLFLVLKRHGKRVSREKTVGVILFSTQQPSHPGGS